MMLLFAKPQVVLELETLPVDPLLGPEAGTGVCDSWRSFCTGRGSAGASGVWLGDADEVSSDSMDIPIMSSNDGCAGNRMLACEVASRATKIASPKSVSSGFFQQLCIVGSGHQKQIDQQLRTGHDHGNSATPLFSAISSNIATFVRKVFGKKCRTRCVNLDERV